MPETIELGLLFVGDQETHDVVFVGLAVVLADRSSRPATLSSTSQPNEAPRGRSSRTWVVLLMKTGGVLGALQIARHPVEAFGDSREHQAFFLHRIDDPGVLRCRRPGRS
jgi:hypothetical protein